jgi:hypothetical protein
MYCFIEKSSRGSAFYFPVEAHCHLERVLPGGMILSFTPVSFFLHCDLVIR